MPSPYKTFKAGFDNYFCETLLTKASSNGLTDIEALVDSFKYFYLFLKDEELTNRFIDPAYFTNELKVLQDPKYLFSIMVLSIVSNLQESTSVDEVDFSYKEGSFFTNVLRDTSSLWTEGLYSIMGDSLKEVRKSHRDKYIEFVQKIHSYRSSITCRLLYVFEETGLVICKTVRSNTRFDREYRILYPVFDYTEVKPLTFNIPMVCPPRKWNKKLKGGFITSNNVSNPTFNRLKNNCISFKLSDTTLEGLNNAQKYSSKINEPVFNILKDMEQLTPLLKEKMGLLDDNKVDLYYTLLKDSNLSKKEWKVYVKLLTSHYTNLDRYYYNITIAKLFLKYNVKFYEPSVLCLKGRIHSKVSILGRTSGVYKFLLGCTQKYRLDKFSYALLQDYITKCDNIESFLLKRCNYKVGDYTNLLCQLDQNNSGISNFAGLTRDLEVSKVVGLTGGESSKFYKVVIDNFKKEVDYPKPFDLSYGDDGESIILNQSQ